MAAVTPASTSRSVTRRAAPKTPASLPRSPPPSRSFLNRSRKQNLGKQVDAETVQAYESLRELMAQLTALGIVKESPLEQDVSFSMHANMFVRHFRRAIALTLKWLRRAVCGDDAVADKLSSSSSSSRRKSRRRSSSYIPLVEEEEGDDGPDDSGLEGSPTPESLDKRGLIMPVGTWKENWDLLVLMLILYSAVMVPVRVCFDSPAVGIMWKVEVGMTFLFIFDCYLSFNTIVFHNQTGKWITGRAQIRQRYLSSWFWVDAPSSVPVEIITLFVDAHGLSMLRVLRMVRLVRLVKLLKIEEYIETLENNFEVNLRILRVVFMIIKMVFLMHVMGCFWWGLSVLGAETADESWRHMYEDGAAAAPDVTLNLAYMYSLYWSATTMTTIGYGDLIPGNDVERKYAVFAMLVAAIIFGYMLSQVGVLVASLDRQAALVEEKVDIAKDYVAWRDLPHELGVRIKKHVSFAYTKKTGFDEVKLIDGLSPSLRAEVTRHVLKHTLGQLPLFAKQLDPDFQVEVFPYIRPVSYGTGEVVFRKGEPSRELMFLLAGVVGVYSQVDDKPVSLITTKTETILGADGKEVGQVENAGVFGESVVLGRRRTETVVARAICETLVLGKDDIELLFEKSERTAARIITFLRKTAERRHRIQSLTKKFLIAVLPRDRSENGKKRAALIVQRRWEKARVALLGPDGEALSLAEKVALKQKERAQEVNNRVAQLAERAVLTILRETRAELGQVAQAAGA